jgi:hypothetical protein
MGYLRSIMEVMKSIGKDASSLKNYENTIGKKLSASDVTREKFSLLEGMTKIPKEEYGRFNKFKFSELNDNTAGVYQPASRNIRIDEVQSDKYLETFLHELEHAKQFNPDAHEMSAMRGLVANSNTRSYYNQPIERLARLVSSQSMAKPRTFSDVHDYELNKDWVNMNAEHGNNLIYNTERGLLSQEDQYKVMKDLINIRKYSGKGWLWGAGGTGVAPFLERSGEE